MRSQKRQRLPEAASSLPGARECLDRRESKTGAILSPKRAFGLYEEVAYQVDPNIHSKMHEVFRMPNGCWWRLPSGMLHTISAYLTVSDVYATRRVSKSWHLVLTTTACATLGPIYLNKLLLPHVGTFHSLRVLDVGPTFRRIRLDTFLKHIVPLTKLQCLLIQGHHNNYATWLSDRGMYHISRILSLRRLHVAGCSVPGRGFGPAGIRSLASLPNLRMLDLSGCESYADPSLWGNLNSTIFTEVSLLTKLTSLNLSGTNATETDIQGLVTLRGLQELILPERVTERTVVSLTALECLRCLDLRETPLSLVRLSKVFFRTLPLCVVLKRFWKHHPPRHHLFLKGPLAATFWNLDTFYCPPTSHWQRNFKDIGRFVSAYLTVPELLVARVCKVWQEGLTLAVCATLGLFFLNSDSTLARNIGKFSNLQVLDVKARGSCDNHDVFLGTIGHLTQLRALQFVLRGSVLTDSGLLHLTRLTSLERLHLVECCFEGFGPAGLGHLAKLPHLQMLDLTRSFGTHDQDQPCHILFQEVCELTGLTCLNLSGCTACETNIQTLVDLTRLQELTLHECRGATNRSVHNIVLLTSLRRLNVTGCSLLSADTCAYFREVRPDCVLITDGRALIFPALRTCFPEPRHPLAAAPLNLTSFYPLPLLNSTWEDSTDDEDDDEFPPSPPTFGINRSSCTSSLNMLVGGA